MPAKLHYGGIDGDARPANAEFQVDLKLDYQRNLERYPLYQEYFRIHRPPLLAMWGREDTFFVPAGAEAFRRDIPDERIVLLDTGHFVLETCNEAVAQEIEQVFGGDVRFP